MFPFLFFQASLIGGMAIADLVKTTLGPKGMVRFLLY
jgi:chaperonin GroEL (HSP60 family)